MKLTTKQILMVFGILFILNSIYAISNVGIFSNVVIAIELLLMAVLAWRYIFNNGLVNRQDKQFTYVLIFFSVIHFIVSTNSKVSDFLKVVCPLVFFLTGKHLINYELTFSRIFIRYLIISICLLPFFIKIGQSLSLIPDFGFYSIFINSNNFAYYFIVASVLVYLLTSSIRNMILYLLVGFLFSKTMGALLGICIAAMVVYWKELYRPRYIVSFVVLAGLIYTLISYSEVEVFVRVRDTYSTYIALSQGGGSLSTLQNIEYSEASQVAEGNINSLSFLFRIKNWTEIMDSYWQLDFINMMFGAGFGSVMEITSTHLVAHNDYLGLLYEFGLIPLCLLVVGYFNVLGSIRAKNVICIPFFAIAVYHFTENLYYNFLVTSLHFLLLGIVFSINKAKSLERISL